MGLPEFLCIILYTFWRTGEVPAGWKRVKCSFLQNGGKGSFNTLQTHHCVTDTWKDSRADHKKIICKYVENKIVITRSQHEFVGHRILPDQSLPSIFDPLTALIDCQMLC